MEVNLSGSSLTECLRVLPTYNWIILFGSAPLQSLDYLYVTFLMVLCNLIRKRRIDRSFGFTCKGMIMIASQLCRHRLNHRMECFACFPHIEYLSTSIFSVCVCVCVCVFVHWHLNLLLVDIFLHLRYIK